MSPSKEIQRAAERYRGGVVDERARELLLGSRTASAQGKAFAQLVAKAEDKLGVRLVVEILADDSLLIEGPAGLLSISASGDEWKVERVSPEPEPRTAATFVEAYATAAEEILSRSLERFLAARKLRKHSGIPVTAVNVQAQQIGDTGPFFGGFLPQSLGPALLAEVDRRGRMRR